MTTATKTGTRRGMSAAQQVSASADQLTTSHSTVENRTGLAGGDHLSHDHHGPTETQGRDVVADHFPGQAIGTTHPMLVTPDLGSYRTLRVIAEMLWDAQKSRIAVQNRCTRADIDPTLYAASLAAIERAEHECKLGLAKAYRKTVSPEIREWQKDTRGVGEHLLASLLGVIGHPVWTERHRWIGEGASRELESLGVMRRRVSDLWSYCGHGDATRRRTKGMTADQAAALGNPRAKTIVWLLACAQLKSSGPYRTVYDDARATYQDREGWTPGHQHNAALRMVGKEMLRDLWVAAGGPQ